MKIKPFKGQVYFHVLRPDSLLLDGRKVTPGRTYHATRPNVLTGRSNAQWAAYRKRTPTLCTWGMHASNGLFCDVHTKDWVCLVRLWGNVVHSPSKSAAQRRKVIAMRQWTDTISLAGCFGIKWIYQKDGIVLGGGDNLQKVADWVLAKPYMNIVAP